MSRSRLTTAKSYRERLDAGALGSLGGSMDSGDITDYYVTPYDIGYGRTVKFDHDFLGHEALEGVANAKEHRSKVTLVWNPDDLALAVRSLCEPGTAEGPLRVLPGRQGAAERGDGRPFA